MLICHYSFLKKCLFKSIDNFIMIILLLSYRYSSYILVTRYLLDMLFIDIFCHYFLFCWLYNGFFLERSWYIINSVRIKSWKCSIINVIRIVEWPWIRDNSYSKSDFALRLTQWIISLRPSDKQSNTFTNMSFYFKNKGSFFSFCQLLPMLVKCSVHQELQLVS